MGAEARALAQGVCGQPRLHVPEGAQPLGGGPQLKLETQEPCSLRTGTDVQAGIWQLVSGKYQCSLVPAAPLSREDPDEASLPWDQQGPSSANSGCQRAAVTSTPKTSCNPPQPLQPKGVQD